MHCRRRGSPPLAGKWHCLRRRVSGQAPPIVSSSLGSSRHVMAIMSWRWRRPWSYLGVSLSAERSSLLVRSFFSGREFFFMDFLSFGDPSRRCSRSSSRRWGCGDSCRRWHSADSTGLRRDPGYQLPRRLRRAADFGGGALGGRRTRPVLLSIGAKSSSARGGAVAAHFLVPILQSGMQTGLAHARGSRWASGSFSSFFFLLLPVWLPQ